MSENSKEKKPLGWFFKNFIGGIIFSYAVWAALFLVYNKDSSIAINLLIAIIPGICGAMGYVLVKLWHDYLYSHFLIFSRINPLTLVLFRYIIWPAVGCILFPFALYILYLKIKGEL